MERIPAELQVTTHANTVPPHALYGDLSGMTRLFLVQPASLLLPRGLAADWSTEESQLPAASSPAGKSAESADDPDDSDDEAAESTQVYTWL